MSNETPVKGEDQFGMAKPKDGYQAPSLDIDYERLMRELSASHLHTKANPKVIGRYVGRFLDTIEAVLFMQDFSDRRLPAAIKHLRLIYDRLMKRLLEADQLPSKDEIFSELVSYLPQLKENLSVDIDAAYSGDPAARNKTDIVMGYPSIRALLYYRIAHYLLSFQVPSLPRIITERAHSLTGIDIHPGAKIGRGVFFDHGTGIVIGETASIGKNCRIYQGVTLGSLRFPKNSDGSLKKNFQRHPTVGDNVTIYAGATILGPITIGPDSVIGGNVWLTESVPAKSRIIQTQFQSSFFKDGDGI